MSDEDNTVSGGENAVSGDRNESPSHRSDSPSGGNDRNDSPSHRNEPSGPSDPSGRMAAADDAEAALRAADRARATSNLFTPWPRWCGPVAGACEVAGVALFFGSWPHRLLGTEPSTLLGLALLAVFPALCVLRARRTSVVTLPPGTTRQRMVTEFTPILALPAAALVYLASGWDAAVLTGAILSGAGLWRRCARHNRLAAEARAKLAA
ncbi:hypothetical protein [Streptomyces sp. ICBB 8177]|uniref:hypothetical protein n=1 Tax=Streptomyces sp. ICBB 8177 TaxID=563922 RepID=UPI0011B5B85C|nr:hypothetical protein [Streptomyces sp. ICBB 8177]